MLRLTRAGEYAVRCVLYLSGIEPGTVVSRKTVAREADIPDGFLGKIAQELARSGILQIVQGAKGGYRLQRSPENITLLDVVEAMTGVIGLNDCVLRPGSCSKSPVCPVHRVWARARDELRDTLGTADFATLLREGGLPMAPAAEDMCAAASPQDPSPCECAASSGETPDDGKQ